MPSLKSGNSCIGRCEKPPPSASFEVMSAFTSLTSLLILWDRFAQFALESAPIVQDRLKPSSNAPPCHAQPSW